MNHTYVWQTLYQPGLEHCQVIIEEDGVLIDSVVVGIQDGMPFRLIYLARLSAEFRFRSVEIISITDTDRQLILQVDDLGNWLDASNGGSTMLSELQGCTDIDIAVTPFTNSLPIWRLQLPVGEAADVSVAYIAAPELTIRLDRQRYTLLETNDEASIYRFDALDTGFTADVRVDKNGVVSHYEGLFNRL